MKRIAVILGLIILSIGLAGIYVISSMNPRSMGAIDGDMDGGLAGGIYLGPINIGLLRDRSYSILIIRIDRGLSIEDISLLKDRVDILLGYIDYGYINGDSEYFEAVEALGIIHGEVDGLSGYYYVEFWRPEWINLIIRYAGVAHRLGYDGIVLGYVDAYLDIEAMGPDWVPFKPLSRLAADSLKEIISTIKSRYGDGFLVILDIYESLSLLRDEELARLCDGVLKRELWMVRMGVEVVEACECHLTVIYDVLDSLRAEGKIVIILDPVSSRDEALKVISKARERGYIPIPHPVRDWGFTSPTPIY